MSTQVEAKTIPGLTRGERSQLKDEPVGGGRSAPVLAITERELVSLFYSPIAYVVGFIFLLVTGYIFVTETLEPGAEASMRGLFEWMAALLVFAIPILTMRSIADEFASGSIEALMTAPVSDGSVVLGKFFGSLLLYVALLAATAPFLVLMYGVGASPVFSMVLVGYAGMLLLGALFIAVGIFASSCTRHQLLSAIISIAILCLFTFGADRLAERGPNLQLQQIGSYLNILGHFSDFGKGIVDTASLIFFFSGTALFLFLATKVMESRRWR